MFQILPSRSLPHEDFFSNLFLNTSIYNIQEWHLLMPTLIELVPANHSLFWDFQNVAAKDILVWQWNMEKQLL